MKTLYIECNMGAAGDMLMSALYELLEDKQGFLDVMNNLGLPGVKLKSQRGVTCGIAGTHMEVTVYGEEELEHMEHPERESHARHHGHEHGHHHASPGYIADLIGSLNLPEEVKRNAAEVYHAIAKAEAKAHGCPVEEVHFHEVGALDAVADVTGVCYAMYLLAPEQITVSPVHVGSGTVRCAHGIMPVPAPATANLLSGIPIYGGDVQGELCTPTGAALLAHFADEFGPMPVMAGQEVGIGIGSRQFKQANCVRVFAGETQENLGNGTITELVCNIDDMTPEALAFARERLLELGALDVYTVPGTMKKGRAGYVLSVLCETERTREFAEHVLRQTTSNGLRVHRCEKYFLMPGINKVKTEYGEVRVKTAKDFGITHAKPEYEDIAALARRAGVPYQKVYEAALRKMPDMKEKE
nr:nickel pincer cofactor biosynthesis protein LarC [uncultured Mediterraneibacter sp.]